MRLGLLVTIGLILGCSSIAPRGGGSLQPYVRRVDPGADAVLTSLSRVTVAFSKAIDPQSIHARSFLILPAAADLNVAAYPSDRLESDIEKGKIVGLKGSYRLSGDGREAVWESAEPLAPQTYHVLVTSSVRTTGHFPLSQTPGMGNQHFWSRFTVNEAATPAGNAGGGLPDTGVSPPERLGINEILYDPAEAETDGYGFIELSGTPGAALKGYVVRFVNGADGKKTGEVVLPDGTIVPSDGIFVIADAKTGEPKASRVANADWVANFDPQNGPDSIQLLAPNGELIDAIGYGQDMQPIDVEGNALFEGSPAVDCASGSSLTRMGGVDTDNNAADFTESKTPTPGVDLPPAPPLASNDPEPENPPDRVRITEIVTDPQQDWSDSAAGNAIAFDSFPGNGAASATDEWIEVKNDTEDVVNLTGWRMEMLDGSDESVVLGTMNTHLFFSDGGSVSEFAPEEFLVVGNPPGEMNNAIVVRLYDAEDALVDELEVEDGNSSGLDDESYQLNEENFWERGFATPAGGE